MTLVVRTARLELVPLTVTGAREVREGFRAADWAVDYPADGDVASAGLVLERVALTGDPGPWSTWQLRYAGLVVGQAGFVGPPDEDGMVEIGYGVVPSARGGGLATEALVGLLGWALAQPGVRRVRADTQVDNVASQRVLEKAGMRMTGEWDGLRLFEIESGRAP